MILFAESSFTPPGGIAGWLACLAFMLWIIHLVQKIHAYAKAKPAPGDVARDSAERYVAKTEFTAHVIENNHKFETLTNDLKTDRADNEKHASQRSKTLFTEIHASRDKVEKKIDERCDRQDTRINRISVGVARLCGRLNVTMPSEDAEI